MDCCLQVTLPETMGLLFHKLQTQLKSQNLRLQHLFDKFDDDGSGLLDSEELAKLISHLLPQVKHCAEPPECRVLCFTKAQPNILSFYVIWFCAN